MTGRYAICFDFPEETEPVFASRDGDAMGFAQSLSSARLYVTELGAERALKLYYAPHVARFGVVVELDSGGAVEPGAPQPAVPASPGAATQP